MENLEKIIRERMHLLDNVDSVKFIIANREATSAYAKVHDGYGDHIVFIKYDDDREEYRLEIYDLKETL